MYKKDVDKIVAALVAEGWKGKTHKDFAEKLGYKYSYGQIERIRVRYLYITGKLDKNNK
ncbi:MAG: hypothetical protein OSJ45_02450 [Lachnospiraceae bacterium]|nr:hypothetical protein [Lachnospiraceae bacterium]